MSKIGATPTFGPKIRLDDGCHVLSCLNMKWPYMYRYTTEYQWQHIKTDSKPKIIYCIEDFPLSLSSSLSSNLPYLKSFLHPSSSLPRVFPQIFPRSSLRLFLTLPQIFLTSSPNFPQVFPQVFLKLSPKSSCCIYIHIRPFHVQTWKHMATVVKADFRSKSGRCPDFRHLENGT